MAEAALVVVPRKNQEIAAGQTTPPNTVGPRFAALSKGDAKQKVAAAEPRVSVGAVEFLALTFKP